MIIRYWLNIIFLNIAEILFPRFCINCKREGLYICQDCSLFMTEAGFICPSCQKPSYFGKRHKRCKDNLLEGLINLYDYEGVVKQAIHYIKNGTFHILEEITERFFSTIEKDPKRFSHFLHFLIDKETVISFLPLSCSEKREFNQSEILANYIAKAVGKKKVALFKPEKIPSLVCLGDISEIKKIVLIDDIWASGSTMKECCKILKEKGVEKIWGLTIARM